MNKRLRAPDAGIRESELRRALLELTVALRRSPSDGGPAKGPSFHDNHRKFAVSRVRDCTEAAVVTVVRQRLPHPSGLTHSIAVHSAHLETK